MTEFERKKLLIVDDSKVSRMLIRGFVQAQRPGWEIVEAASGDEALRNALEEVFDYVTADINMPGMDGFELVARLREECPQLRVCLLTSNIQEDSRRRAALFEAGFIRKPITEEGIAQAIAFFETSR